MDLKYYDDNSGKWISLKAMCGVADVADTSINDDSTFATPNYITNKVITKDEKNIIKYYDGTILNKTVRLSNGNDGDLENKFFISKINLQDNNEGTVILTPTYSGIVVGEGDLVSNVSFHDETGDLEITKIKISEDVLNPISSGTEIPNENTPGIFYIQTEENNTTEEDNTIEEDNGTSI